MRIRVPGKICDGLWMLGTEESSVYVVEGKEGALVVNGGMSYLAPDVIRQLDAFGIDESRIKGILVLHAHFDHVGMVPFLRRRLPDLRIYGSKRACEVFRNPKAARTINAFSREVAKRMGKTAILDEYELSWTDDIQGTAVTEGDCIDLGTATLRIYETPGHSACSLAAYMEECKALFASDGAGIPLRDTIDVSPSYDYGQYLKSLEKLEPLDVEYVCADHYGYVTGDEGRTFVRQTITACRKDRALMEELYRRSKDVEKAAAEWTGRMYRENPDYLLTPEILNKVHVQIFRHLADELEGRRPSQG